MSYTPETKFQIEDNLIYNLKQKGLHRGKPSMENDVCIQIQAPHLSKEVRARMAQVCANALNKEFPTS
jgi:hypothetical protein